MLCRFAVCIACLVGVAVQSRAEPVQLVEPFTSPLTLATHSQVVTQGKVFALNAKGMQEPLEIQASASLRFRSRRLPPAGREAVALREAREFTEAHVETTVAGHQTKSDLPAQLKVIVAAGQREGVRSYCPRVLMTRESLDLLEMPGDPLALIALLPDQAIEPGGEWTPSDWAVQMLAGMESATETTCTCKLDSSDGGVANVTLQANVVGQRQGASATVKLVGRFAVQIAQQYITGANLTYSVKSEVGTINPGLEADVNVRLARQPVAEAGLLTTELLESLPLEPTETALELVFDAVPWGMRVLHDRSWHLFQAVYDGQHPVAILRQMESGSLVCQCNIAPVSQVKPGDRTPPVQFEQDIQQSLGNRLKTLTEQEEIPTADGRFIYRVVAQGEVELKGEDKALQLPMNWIYYLVTNRDGRQISFVFAVEPHLRETLGERDRQLVTRMSFFGAGR
ncbi:MAG: hypothetical protein KDA58_15125 [Planctomycetaceae bacterium]|nr:hypothetical protein [Planctomycetaceae bacterium]